MKIVTMCAPLALHATTDVLMRFARANEDHAEKEKELNKLCERLKTLYTLRNNVVHALWLMPPSATGLASLLSPYTAPHDIATGVGVPKKGRKITIPLSMTAAQIRDVARQIGEAERALYELTHQPTPTSKRKARARALMAPPSPQPNPATP